MATHSGDGAQKEPVEASRKDQRWPLEVVAFTSPTKVAGANTMVTTLEAGVMRLVDGREWCVGPMWFDPAARVVQIEGLTYPMERVHYMKRAKMAITKRPPSLDLEKYTIRAKSPTNRTKGR